MTEADIQTVFDYYTTYEDVIEKVKIVTIADIREKDYSLAINNYIEKKEQETVPPEEIRRQYFEAYDEMIEAETRMRELLLKGATSVSKRITIEELQSYLWNSAVLLRTNIDAGAYKQYIFPLLFFKRICDVYDEETSNAVEEYGDDASEFDEDEIHTFIVPEGLSLE